MGTRQESKISRSEQNSFNLMLLGDNSLPGGDLSTLGSGTQLKSPPNTKYGEAMAETWVKRLGKKETSSEFGP